MELNEILLEALTRGASDVHIKIGQPPIVRIDGQLKSLEGARPYNYNEVNQTALGIMNEWQKERFLREKEVDMGYEIQGLGRFRVNIFQQRGKIRIALRIVPYQIKSIPELNLPGVLEKIAMENRGLILVTGTTGSGKSTTLASMVWRVLITRCPVSAAVNAVSMVSKSLISPIRMTSGSCLRALLRALAKVPVSEPTSL